jgi:hypothetical protein
MATVTYAWSEAAPLRPVSDFFSNFGDELDPAVPGLSGDILWHGPTRGPDGLIFAARSVRR